MIRWHDIPINFEGVGRRGVTMATPMSKRYQIFVVRDGHFETDGCWLYSDEDRWFTSFVEACEMADFLGGQYPDVDWVVADENGNEFYRVVATEPDEWE